MKKVLLLFAVIGSLISYAGIYRHDVAVEKYMELATDEAFAGTGQLYSFTDGVWRLGGSCVLIDSLHVLTAAHCVTEDIKKDTVVEYRGYKVSTYVSLGKKECKPSRFWVLINGQHVTAKRVVCYPGYLKDGVHDLAVIELKEPVRNTVCIPLNTNMDEVGDTVTGVGFGGSGTADGRIAVSGYSIKIAGQNIIDSAGGVMVHNKPSRLYMDLDCPSGSYSTLGSNIPLAMEYGVKGGDSGGPLFRKKNNRWELIGILCGSDGSLPFSEAQGYYGQVDNWTRISAFYDWINETVRKPK